MKILLYFLFLFSKITFLLDDCTKFEEYYYCGEKGGGENRIEWDKRCFQVPRRGGTADPVYRESYQDMHYLQGYTKLRYNQEKTLCNISVYTKINTEEVNMTSHELIYTFGTTEQSSEYFILTKDNDTYPDGLNVSVRIIDKDSNTTFASLELEEEYFIWNVPKIDYDNETLYQDGQKGAIVELFGWPYEDIIEETDFLKITGYLGVKITPPNEHVMTEAWMESNGLNPWEYFIQPVSYRIKSRLGNKKDLINLINKCKKKGIRIYSQVVINQMTYMGNDVYNDHYTNCIIDNNWPGKNASAGSPFFTCHGRVYKHLNPYTNKLPIFEYPGVPYCGSDFNCRRTTNSLSEIYNGWPGADHSLNDLDTSKEYVQQRIADFLTELISLGIAGFSIYNAKYIAPNDYIQIFKKFKENLGGGDLPKDFIIIFEINIKDDNENNYLFCDNNQNFAQYLTNELKKYYSIGDVYKFKLQSENYIKYSNISCNKNDWEINETRFSLSFENQDMQYNDENNIRYQISDMKTHYDRYSSMFGEKYKSQIRKVFSSYSLPENGGNGFPDGLSDCTHMPYCVKQTTGAVGCQCTKNVPKKKAFLRNSTGYDTGDNNNWKYNDYTRVHRRREIVNSMRKWMGLPEFSEEEYLKVLDIILPEIPEIQTTIITTIPKTTILSTLPKTTFITTIPKTTILTTLPKTTVITTIPKTTILSTLPKTTFITTIPKTTILTTLPKTTVVTTIPKIIILTTFPKTTLITTIPKTTILTTLPKTTFITTTPKIIILTTLPKTTLITTIPKTTILKPIPKTTFLVPLPKTVILTTIMKLESTIIKNDITEISEEIIHCLDNYFSHDTIKDIYYHYCPNYSRDCIKEDINDIVHRIKEKTRYSIQAKDFVAKIAPIDYTTENENTEIFAPSTYVDFTECEKILREAYTILPPKKITFVQIEIENFEDNILVNQIEYQAYDEDKKELNLSLCDIKNIEIYYSLKNTTKDKMNYISLFRKKGIDILDINDNFFNDICLPYSELGKDLTLNDRIENIYKNYTFCEKNCKLEEILFDEMAVLCNCSVKEDINVKELNFDLKKYEINKKNTNFKITKCYDSFFSIKDNLKNLGFWIFLILILLHIIFFILFCCLGIKPFKLYIEENMAKCGYIKKGDEGHAFCHNYEKKLNKLIERLNQLKKENEINKKKNEKAPPKRKVHELSINEENSKRSMIKKDKEKLVKKNTVKADLEQLKIRMEKTRKKNKSKSSSYKVKIYKSTKDKIIENDDNKFLPKKNDSTIKTDNLELLGKNRETDKEQFDLNLININVSDIKKTVYVPNESKYILNIYDFEEAKKYDKRSLFSIYYIFLIAKQSLIHAILYKSPIETFPIRFSLLIYLLSCDLALNNIFYTDDKVSDKYYSDKNVILLAFTSNITVILLSTLISYIFLTLFASLNNSTNEIRKIFRKEEEKIKNNQKYIVTVQRKKEIIYEIKKIMKIYKVKVAFIYILQLLFMLFYWYYATIFCNIYNRTQVSWLLDSIVTIVFRIILDFLINLILSVLYINSITCKNICFYRFIIFVYCLG